MNENESYFSSKITCLSNNTFLYYVFLFFIFQCSIFKIIHAEKLHYFCVNFQENSNQIFYFSGNGVNSVGVFAEKNLFSIKLK